MEFRTYETWSFPTSVQDVVDFAVTFNGHSQPVIHDYPWSLPCVAIVLYLIMVHYLPSVMAKREAFDLRWALKIWNFLLVVLSVFIFWGMIGPVVSFLSHRGFYNMICLPNGELYVGLPFFCIWLFALSKFAELIDTLFLILRKRPVNFLHWYHHTTVLAYTYFSMAVLTPPGAIFGVVNAGVHTVMYWYYFLAACGRRPSWGKLVTVIQLSQMVVGITTASCWTYFYLSGDLCPIDHPRAYMFSSLALYGSYFALFLNFYINRYTLPTRGGSSQKKTQ